MNEESTQQPRRGRPPKNVPDAPASLDIELLDHYAAPIAASIAQVEWAKGHGSNNHQAIAYHALRIARAIVAQKDQPVHNTVMAEGKRAEPSVLEPLQEIDTTPRIVGPDGSVPPPAQVPPSPLSPVVDLPKPTNDIEALKKTMMGAYEKANA